MGEQEGVCGDGYRFIYLTGSGAWSRLLEPGPLEPLLEEAEQLIPKGYTQLWILEKKFCAAPDDARSRLRRERLPAMDGRPHAHSYVVLQDPVWARQGPVVLSHHTKEGEAIAHAQAQANELGVRTVVGLLLADVTWH